MGGASSPSIPSRLSPAARRGLAALAVILFLVGASLIAYPYVSDYINRRSQARVTQRQTQVVTETAEEDLSAEFEHAWDFNARLLAGRVMVTDPFDPDNVAPTDEEYEGVLNLAGDGVMGTIAIPSIDVYLPIYHGVEGEGMDHGVGHMPSTSLPVGGASSHSVIAGHTGLPSAIIFDNLTKLAEGDWFVITVLGEDMAYEVTGTEVVLPDETQSLHVVEGEDLVTLVTCTPYGVNTHRLLVHARRCDIPAGWLDVQDTVAVVPFVPETVAETPKFIFTVIGLVASLVLLVVIALLVRRHRRRLDAAQSLGAWGQGPAPSAPVTAAAAPEPEWPVAPLGQAVPMRQAAPARVAPTRGSLASRVPVIDELTLDPIAPKGGPKAAPGATTVVSRAAAPSEPASSAAPRHARHAAPEAGQDVPRRGAHFRR